MSAKSTRRNRGGSGRTEEERGQINAHHRTLGFSNTNVAKVERSSEVFLPLGEEEGNQNTGDGEEDVSRVSDSHNSKSSQGDKLSVCKKGVAAGSEVLGTRKRADATRTRYARSL
jgi:hypothetical protein